MTVSLQRKVLDLNLDRLVLVVRAIGELHREFLHEFLIGIQYLQNPLGVKRRPHRLIW